MIGESENENEVDEPDAITSEPPEKKGPPKSMLSVAKTNNRTPSHSAIPNSEVKRKTKISEFE